MAQTTTFADLCPITRTSSHTYDVNLLEEWIIGTVPNGGYTTSNFLICARTHMSTTHTKLNQPHPINLHLEFLRRTSVGPATFIVRDVKLGSRITNLHLTLTQNNDPKTSIVEGYIMMSNIPKEEGLSLPTSYALHPPPLPASIPTLEAHGEDQNYRRRGPEPFPSFRRAVLNVALYLVKPSQRPKSWPKSINDQWIRLAPLPKTSKPTDEQRLSALGTGRWTNDSIGFLVDMFPQIIEHYINPVAERAAIEVNDVAEMRKIIEDINKTNGGGEPASRARYWYPTLTLTLNVKKLLPPEGVDWLFVRVQSKVIKQGRFDLDVSVWDEAGEMVANSLHASLALDSSRNIARSKKKEGKL
ncbi:uncharacterized protein AB675_292 [Cyphellophora attinorum]|uniref:Thioesterase domain-containing protein n=1 Tax=Cyphellophora attinorum TaxID=1664694 RepID=A0A0N1HC25_9EURO|nr:uncharacterized protein AB675_292 [Phialophora attinorum]KPI45893.1 hypothetical protein AB675_292 [Phialophora attinorum]